MGVSHARGGLGRGTGLVSIVLAIVIAALVGYMTVTGKDAAATPAPQP
jgi:uncharacterized membrane-anchored protein